MNSVENRPDRMPFPNLMCAVNPRVAFAGLANRPQQVTLWQCLQGALSIAFICAGSVLLLASAPLTIWLLVSATVCWCVVPLAGFIGLYAVAGRSHPISLAHTVDTFFAGYTPWLLWFLSIATLCSLLTPLQAENFVFGRLIWVVSATVLVVAWSAYIDYLFFTMVLRFPHSQALKRLAFQRAISWALLLTVYVFSGFLPFVADVLSQASKP